MIRRVLQTPVRQGMNHVMIHALPDFIGLTVSGGMLEIQAFVDVRQVPMQLDILVLRNSEITELPNRLVHLGSVQWPNSAEHYHAFLVVPQKFE